MREEFVDVETRSVVSLPVVGAHVYAEHPSTEVLCICHATDDDEPEMWFRGDPVPPVFFDIAANPQGWRVIAFNGEFERALFKHVLAPLGFPILPDHVHHCAQRLALANAYPAELGMCCEALGLPFAKDPAARKALLQVTRPKQERKNRKPSTKPTYDEDPAKLQLVYQRCRDDVLAERAVWRSPKLKPLSPSERRLQLTDIAINDRGIQLDRRFTEAARDIAIHARTSINLRLAELTDNTITSADQVARFKQYLEERGHKLTKLDKKAVASALAAKPDDHVRALLTLRQQGARASVNKFKTLIDHAGAGDRMRGNLRMYGTGTGRWSGLKPQLQNLKRNERSYPLELVEAVRNRDCAEILKYGNPLEVLSNLQRAALRATPGMELKSADLSAIEVVVLCWLVGEEWKLTACREFKATGDTSNEPYKVTARKMLRLAENVELTDEQRQLGKCAELAFGFGGAIGAWRRIVPGDARTDVEIDAIVRQWRAAHPATRKYWADIMGAIRKALRTGEPVLIAPAPLPPVTASFECGNLLLTLPSGRNITYPNAHLVPSKFEGQSHPDIQFHENKNGQWRPFRAWFGTFIENVVQAVARDLLSAAIERCEASSIAIVHHCHDDLVAEIDQGRLTDEDFLNIVLTLPAWAAGLPLSGKCHSGPHYLAAPKDPAKPCSNVDNVNNETLIDIAIDAFVDADIGAIDDPDVVEREDDQDYVKGLPDSVAPLPELCSFPLAAGNKVSCPFHDDPTPSCVIYSDHFHCYGCSEHGGRIDWLVRAEAYTKAEAFNLVKDWPASAYATPEPDCAETLRFVKKLWTEAQPLPGTIAESYLAETRHIDVTKLPDDLHRCLRFHPRCIFGPGNYLPCLIALMRDAVTDKPVGIQRTALELRDGRAMKIDRRMLGNAGVVKLWPVNGRLVVGEGLETVLAAATRIPFKGSSLTPAWAALSSRALANLPLIEGVSRLVVLVDNDANQEGQQAAERLAAMWRTNGRAVMRLMPSDPDSDFNDAILKNDNDVVA